MASLQPSHWNRQDPSWRLVAENSSFAKLSPPKHTSSGSWIMLYDVFICHASEDKAEIARPLAERLRSRRVEVWYDEFTLTAGMSLREAIDRGLAKSRYGIVILKPGFFRKAMDRVGA
jgi:TIR domain